MKNFGTIIDNFDAVTKQYVDNQDALKLDKAGGSITGNLTVGGNLTINGTTTTVDSTTLQVKDKLIEVAHGNTTTLTTPAGLVAPKYDGTNSGALVFDSTGTAYVGDVTLKDGNIDVANSDLQPLATRTGLVGGNLVQYDSSAQTLNDSGKKISDLALKTDIPTNYVTTDTTQNNITGKKTFTNTIVKKSTTIDLNAKPTSGTQWNYIEFTDKNDDRIGIAGSRFDAGGYAGVYLQARNSQQLWIASSTPDSNGNTVTKTSTPTPPATDDSTQIANTSWVRTNYQEKGYAGIDGAVVNSDGKVTDKDGNVVDALYFKVASLTTTKAYMRTYLLAEVAMTNIVNEQSTVLIRCTTESSTSAPNVTITFDNYSYASLLLPKNIFVTADYKSGTAGATFTVWVKQDKNFMQQVWNVLSQNTRNYTTTSKREWRVFYSNITKATAVTDINAAPTGYTRIVANNNNRYSNLEENTYLWQQSQNAGITWKRYSDNTTRGVFRQNDNGTTATFVTQSDGFLFRPLDNNNTKSIKVDPKTGVLYPEKDLGADLGKTAQRWRNGYITNLQNCKVINGGGGNSLIQQNSDTAGADITVGSTNCALKMLGKNARPTYRQGKNGTYANLALQSDIPFNTVGLSTGTLGSTKLPSAGRYYIECDHVNYSTFDVSTLVSCVLDFNNKNTTQTGVIVVGYVGGSAIHYYYILNIASTGLVTLSTMLDEQQGISGSFKYKKIN